MNMSIDIILENLLKEHNVYDEQEIQERMKKWPGRSARRNALYNIGLSKDVFDETTIDLVTLYIAFQNNLQGNVNDLYQKIKLFDADTFEKLSDLSRFYYTQCKDPELFSKLDPSFKLIIMSSVIEMLMSSEKFLEFDAWYFKECPNSTKKESETKNLDEAIKYLWKEYKLKHGAYRRFKKFFELHLSEDEQQELLRGFKNLDKKSTNIKHISKWLYQMRSDFVHNATHVQLPEPIPRQTVYIGHVIGGDPVSISTDVNQILSIFEKGFLRYFGLL